SSPPLRRAAPRLPSRALAPPVPPPSSDEPATIHVHSGETLVVSSGQIVSGAVVETGAIVRVLGRGLESAGTIQAGAVEYVFSRGSAIGDLVAGSGALE